MVEMLWCYLNNENTLNERLVATFRIFARVVATLTVSRSIVRPRVTVRPTQ